MLQASDDCSPQWGGVPPHNDKGHDGALNEKGIGLADHGRGELENHSAFHHQKVSPMLDQLPRCGVLLSPRELALQLAAEGCEEWGQPLKMTDDGGGLKVLVLPIVQHFSHV